MNVRALFVMLVAVLLPLNAEAQLMPVDRCVVYHYIYENKKENSTYRSKVIVADVADDAAQTVTNLLCDYGDSSKEMFAGVFARQYFVYDKNSRVTLYYPVSSSMFVDMLARIVLKSQGIDNPTDEQVKEAVGEVNKKIKCEGEAFVPLRLDSKLGEEFADSKMQMKISLMSFKVEIKKGRYEGVQKVTTPAGEFDCVQVSYQMKMKVMFAGETSYITEWYAPGVGIVRTEEKDKKGNVLVSGILNRIEKVS